MADMGGVRFFNIALETPIEGDWALMQAVMDGFNKV